MNFLQTATFATYVYIAFVVIQAALVLRVTLGFWATDKEWTCKDHSKASKVLTCANNRAEHGRPVIARIKVVCWYITEPVLRLVRKLVRPINLKELPIDFSPAVLFLFLNLFLLNRLQGEADLLVAGTTAAIISAAAYLAATVVFVAKRKALRPNFGC